MARTSDKQEKILAFLNRYIEENGYPPAVREIGAAVGLKSTATVSYHLGSSSARGASRPIPASAALSPCPRGSGGGKIPVLGVVTAGLPILAQENVEGYIPWDGDPSYFALRVRGESMVGAGILSGDIVVVRQQQSADHGDIVVALLGDEATVKRLKLDDTGVWLMPENPAFDPIDGREATILGKVKALYREFE